MQRVDVGPSIAQGRVDPPDRARLGRPDARERPFDDLPDVVVDYAHTPDALDKVCGTLRAVGEGRLLVVFGCGGDRDRSKRAPMARAVAARAHLAILTSDNPRSEDPEAILDDMQTGLQGVAGDWRRVPDRGEAIRLAVQEAQAGDTVLIAGKGHETYQEVHGVRHPLLRCRARAHAAAGARRRAA